MRSFKEIKSHYDFSIEDERLLASIRELMALWQTVKQA
jgi:hypothetical protein